MRPEAPPATMHGGPVKPRHSAPGEQTRPYPWEEFAGPHGPYGPAEDSLLSDLPESETLAAGNLGQDWASDRTPYYTHAGPNITGMEMDRGPEGSARVRIQSAEAHAVDTNADKKAIQSSDPLQDHWTGFYTSIPGDDILPMVPGAVSGQAGGFGSNDHRNNVYAKVNPYGLANSHRMRRYAYGSIPGNYMWMRPAGRPLAKTLPGPARPAVGEGPFYGQDPGETFGIEGAILLDPATEYVSPAQPYTVPQVQTAESAPPLELW
jgi:hypothetical protein